MLWSLKSPSRFTCKMRQIELLSQGFLFLHFIIPTWESIMSGTRLAQCSVGKFRSVMTEKDIIWISNALPQTCRIVSPATGISTILIEGRHCGKVARTGCGTSKPAKRATPNSSQPVPASVVIRNIIEIQNQMRLYESKASPARFASWSEVP